MSEESAVPQESEEAPPPAGPRGGVILGALIGSLVLGAVAGVFAVGPMVAKRSGLVVQAPAADSTDSEADTSAAKDGQEGGTNLHLIDNLVLNPAGSGGARFLMLAAAVEVATPALVNELKARDAETRDIVLRVLGSKNVEQLSSMALRDSLRIELADSLGTLFKKPKQVRRIYFPQFVIQ